MTTAYDSYGDESPRLSPDPDAPRPAARPAVARGGVFMWTGLALIVLALFFTGSPIPANVVVGAAFFIGGVINLCTAGIIRAIVDTRA